MATTAQFHPHRLEAVLRNWLRRGGGVARLDLAMRWLAAGGLEPGLAALLRVARRRGGVFHLWGHSWEIDAGDRWAALDRALALLAAAVPPAARLDLVELSP